MRVVVWELGWWVYAGGSLGVELVGICRWFYLGSSRSEAAEEAEWTSHKI